jgi:hypothetical protein
MGASPAFSDRRPNSMAESGTPLTSAASPLSTKRWPQATEIHQAIPVSTRLRSRRLWSDMERIAASSLY